MLKIYLKLEININNMKNLLINLLYVYLTRLFKYITKYKKNRFFF